MPYPADRHRTPAPFAAALPTAALVARTTALRAEVREVIERSRDLCWGARQLRAPEIPPSPGTIRGGAADDDAAVVLAMITRVWICQPCISSKSGIPTSRIDGLLTTIAGTIALSADIRRCTACRELRTTYGFDGRATHPGTHETATLEGTKQAILNFLAQHPESAFCASCIAPKLLPGKNIDVAMRHLEGRGMYRRHGRCSACRKLRLIASMPASA